MKKYAKYVLVPLCGAGYAALALLISRLLVRGLSPLFTWVGGLAELNENTLSYAGQILDQFKTAVIRSPWLPALLIGAAIGALAAWLISLRRVKRIAIDILLWLILLLPLALLALWFTELNGIRVGAFISALLPLLPHLL